MAYSNTNTGRPRPLSAGDREKIRTTLAEAVGYDSERTLAELGTLLLKSKYGYSKLLTFAKTELSGVIRITEKYVGGHSHEYFSVIPAPSDASARKPKQDRQSDLYRGRIVRIGVTADGSDYGVIDCSDNDEVELDTLIFYDTGVRGGRTVSDFQEGDFVEYGVFVTRFVKKRGTLVSPCSNGQASRSNQHSQADRRTRISFKDFAYIPRKAFVKIYCALAEDELPNASDREQRDKVLYGKMAAHYDTLREEDFSESPDGRFVTFATGLTAFDGSPITLKCARSTDEKQRVKWHCKEVIVSGSPIGTITSTVQLNWHEVEEDLSTFSSAAEKPPSELIITQIERMFLTRKRDMVWLKQGTECAENEADALYIPTGYFTDRDEASGKELFLCCKRGGDFRRPWSYQIAIYENAPLECYAKSSWLSSWVTLTKEAQSLDDVYEGLARQTLDEPWGFKGGREYEILDNYLKYTFVHQYLSGCIGYSADRKYAAFNTGLPDKGTYDYIYALFKKRDGSTRRTHPLHHQSEYQLIAFTKSGAGYNGKTLGQNINPLPLPPKYFDSRSAMVWNLDFNDRNQVCEPQFDDEHILIVRCDRLPLDFYREVAHQSPRLKSILDDSELSAWDKYSRIKEFLLPVRRHEADEEANAVYQRLYQNLKSRIELAVKKLSWNWRAVVPSFNPTRNEPGFLLPISFCSTKGPDRALVATVQELGGKYVYTIHTVIPLHWAYRDARLVCRPETEWLGLDLLK